MTRRLENHTAEFQRQPDETSEAFTERVYRTVDGHIPSPTKVRSMKFQQSVVEGRWRNITLTIFCEDRDYDEDEDV